MNELAAIAGEFTSIDRTALACIAQQIIAASRSCDSTVTSHTKINSDDVIFSKHLVPCSQRLYPELNFVESVIPTGDLGPLVTEKALEAGRCPSCRNKMAEVKAHSVNNPTWPFAIHYLTVEPSGTHIV